MRILSILLVFWFALSVHAQEMHIQQYAKVKKGILNKNHIKTDKKQATIDLKTSQKGFTFLATGKTEIAAEEGDDILTLKTPDKTTYIVIKHPKYGQLTWKVPTKKGLRKKNRYTATLLTSNPEEEYKLQKQWVIFEIQPSNAIMTIDSTMSIVHNGKLQQYLPIGKHAYKAESPFHSEVKDSFELSDEKQLTIPVTLQPIYSYITVKTALESCDILIDGQHIGKTQATSGHLSEGDHRLVILKDNQKYYDAMVNIGWQEKKTIELTQNDLKPIIEKATTTHQATAREKNVAMNIVPSSIKPATDSAAVVLMNRNTKMNYYGMINVHSNEIGADVYVDGKHIGTTPCIVKQLPAGRSCKIRLEKPGFHNAEKVIVIEGNDLSDVNLTLKKKKGQRR